MFYPGRKKIWEIESDFHCSIIGTCFSYAEVRKFYPEAVAKEWSNYYLHSAAVHAASSKNAVSIKMQKKLEKKYPHYMVQHQRLNDEKGSFELFKKSITQGDVAGHYWALLSSDGISSETRIEAFGEIHMLSHLNGRTGQYTIADLQKKEQKLQYFTEKQKEYRKTIKNLRNTLKQIKMERDLASSELEKMKKNQTEKSINDNALDEHSDYILKQKQEIHEQTIANQKKLYLEIDRLREINTLLKKELYLSNNVMFMEKSCEECSVTSAMQHQHISAQEAADLCGKCILYVGGQHSLVHHYRSIVEKNGGSFVHHDGGREDNIGRLETLILTADKVFCPLDHISHNASLFIKRHCKKHNKDIVMLKSSGVSTFSRELERTL